MEVNEELLIHVAEVARLQLSDKELSEFLPQLKEVINFISKLDEVDVEGVSPSFQPVELKDALREDVKGVCLSQADALSNSKSNQDGFFKGPKAVWIDIFVLINLIIG